MQFQFPTEKRPNFSRSVNRNILQRFPYTFRRNIRRYHNILHVLARMPVNDAECLQHNRILQNLGHSISNGHILLQSTKLNQQKKNFIRHYISSMWDVDFLPGCGNTRRSRGKRRRRGHVHCCGSRKGTLWIRGWRRRKWESARDPSPGSRWRRWSCKKRKRGRRRNQLHKGQTCEPRSLTVPYEWPLPTRTNDWHTSCSRANRSCTSEEARTRTPSDSSAPLQRKK